MTKEAKIEVHAAIVFTKDGPKITVNSHFFGSPPGLCPDLIYALCCQFGTEANALIQHQISNYERGGYDGTPKGA